MSIEYSTAAYLAHTFSVTNCKKIVERGDALGILYENTDFYKLKFSNILLTTEEAIHATMTGTTWDVKALYFKLFDNYSRLIFTGSQDSPSFVISMTSNFWKKEFYVFDENKVIEKHVFVDNARYARLLLDLVEDFSITSFEISEMDYEHLTNLDKNCLTAKIINKDTFRDFCARLATNIYLNKAQVLSPQRPGNAFSKTEAINYIDSHSFNGELSIATRNSTFKLTMLSLEEIALYPLEPIYRKTIGNQSVMDLAFYVRLLLGICENYAIIECKTTFDD